MCDLFLKHTSLGNLISDLKSLRCITDPENSAKDGSSVLNILYYKEVKYDKEEIQMAIVCIITNRFSVGICYPLNTH